MMITEFIMLSHISISALFVTVHAQFLDVGQIYIGSYNLSTGLPTTDDYYVLSISDTTQHKLSVIAVVYRRNSSQIMPKTENITISCDVSAASPGTTDVRITNVTLGAEDNQTFIPLTLTRTGRPLTVKCFGQSQSASCPVTVGGAQFCPETSTSNSVSVAVRPAANVSQCEPVVTVTNNECGFHVRLSEPSSNNVTINCSTSGNLRLTFKPEVVAAGSLDAQMTCTVDSGVVGSEASVTCQAMSQPPPVFASSTGQIVLTANRINFQPSWSQTDNTSFTSLFYLSAPVKSGSVSVECHASVVGSVVEAESLLSSPDCSFTTALPTTESTSTVTSTITTTATTFTVTTGNGTDVNITTDVTTSIAPVTAQPTPPPGWAVVNQLIVISLVRTETSRPVISVRTDIIVTTCCVLSSSSNKDYLNQSAAVVTVAHLAPYVCSRCNNATFSNPSTERTLQNPGFVQVSPCACDVTQSACDINCCCDSDCSQNHRARFSDCIPGLPGGRPAELQDYKCSSDGFDQPDWQTLTCVYWENNWFLGMFFMNRQKLESIDDISSEVSGSYRNKFTLSETESRFTVRDSVQPAYTHGTIVRTIKQDIAASAPTRTGTLAMSQPGPGTACNPLSPVRYLVDQTSACQTMVTSDQCSPHSSLSAAGYVTSSAIAGCPQSYKVLKTFNGDAVAPTDVRYYCATNLSPYLPPTETSLDNLDPTITSKFPADLTNVDCCDGCSEPICWQYNTNRSSGRPTDLPPLCAWDDGFTIPSVPTLDNGTCRHVVVDVRYNLEWNGTEISQLSATIILADIPNVSSITGPDIALKFSVRWLNKASTTVPLSDNYGNTTDTFFRSGTGGYDMGRPLVSGRMEHNVTTGQFNQVDIRAEKQMAIWRPGVNGLCEDALRQPLTFGDNILSDCILRLTFSDLNNTCDELRQLLMNHLNVLMAANAIGRYGYNDVNNENMWVTVLRQQLNMSSSNNQTTSSNTSTTVINQTSQELKSWADSITGVCLLPTAVNLHVLYGHTGAANGYPRYEVLEAHINYGTANWTMDCMGVNRRRCDGLAASYTQNFVLSSSVTFTEVQLTTSQSKQSRFSLRCDPDNFVSDSCYRYFTDLATDECYYDTCWQELAYPVLGVYPGETQLYSLPVMLVLVLGVFGYVSVARPGWS